MPASALVRRGHLEELQIRHAEFDNARNLMNRLLMNPRVESIIWCVGLGTADQSTSFEYTGLQTLFPFGEYTYPANRT